MKNKASFILILLFFSFAYNSFADERPYISLGGKRPIKKIAVKVKYQVDGEISKDKYIFYFTRDKVNIEKPSKGKLIDYFYFLFKSSNGEEFINNLWGRNKYKTKKIYNNGLLIEEKFSFNKKLESQTTYKYNSINQIISKYYFRVDSSCWERTNYEYNNGKLLRETLITFSNQREAVNGIIHFVLNSPKRITEYNNKGYIISVKDYEKNDSLIEYTINKYDDTLLVETINKYKDRLEIREIIKYNKENKVLEKMSYYGDTLVSVLTNKYNNNGYILEYKYCIGDFKNEYNVYEYNKDNIIISKKGGLYYNQQGQILLNSYESKFDERGNEIEINCYDYKGELFSRTIMKYNKWDNLIERIECDHDNRYIVKYTYKYSYWD